MDDLVGLAILLGPPAYLALQLWTAKRWAGGWRVAALAPLAIMAPLVVHAAVAFAAQSNLWPVMVILAAPLAALYLAALAGMRALAR